MIKTACYIHIPFCDHKCIYCDFYSIITLDNINPFLKSLIKEIEFYSSQHSEGREIISIYFGGGTPSLMEANYIEMIVSTVKKNFNVSDVAEITLETNPGTVRLDKLKMFKEAGVNRISIGVQSFDDDELKFLTRIHDSETAILTINEALAAGFENVNIDLIFNLPGQTKEKWLHNLNTASSLPVNHISTYSLIVENGTILNKMIIDEKVRMQDDDHDADLYETTIEYLEANGFQQYEVSNFTKPGFECMHNKAYWHYKDYLGFGTSAHSFIYGKRWWNYSSLQFYLNAIEQSRNAVIGQEVLTEDQMLNEYMMLALRSRGLNLNEFKNRFGSDWLKKNDDHLENFINQGFLVRNNNFIKFTKCGYAVCDEILQKLL